MGELVLPFGLQPSEEQASLGSKVELTLLAGEWVSQP